VLDLARHRLEVVVERRAVGDRRQALEVNQRSVLEPEEDRERQDDGEERRPQRVALEESAGGAG
jgi:hypothetical protein